MLAPAWTVEMVCSKVADLDPTTSGKEADP